jgi:hypothetical protein
MHNMTYKEFLLLDEKPEGKASKLWIGFPLWFDSHDELIEDVAGLNVVDDFMMSVGIDDFQNDFKDHFPSYEIFAICDSKIAKEKYPKFEFDSYAEFFFVADTSKPETPVLIWTGERFFKPFSDSFDEFWNALYVWQGI